MSLSGMLGSLGAVVGVTIAGRMLDQYGFLVLTPVLGAFGVVSVFVTYFFVKDPHRK